MGILQTGPVHYGGCLVHSEGAHAKGRSDGDPTARVCNATLGEEHFAERRTAHHKFLLQITCSHCLALPTHYAKTLE